jgi:hypothetical protein
MATKYKNIVGTGFPDYVKEQLQARQKLVSQTTRSSTALQFLTNRNSFVRLSSGVLVKNDQNDFTNNLAKNNVLQGGTVTINNNVATFNQRYTIGATDNLGFKPNPGITNLSVGTGGRWQTLMQADIEFVCYDLDQLDTMSKLYMSLGCHVFLEWGHIPYIDNTGKLTSTVNTLNFFKDEFIKQDQIIRQINKLRKSSNGNYDALLGRVYNFDFTANADGTYNCKIQVMGPGQMIESIKINSFNNYDYDKSSTIETSKYESVLANLLTSIKKYLIDSKIATLEARDGDTIRSFQNASAQESRDVINTNLGVINNSNFFEPLVSGSTESYGSLLNNIYGSCLYKGPEFRKNGSNVQVIYSNTFSQYGNAHQITSGLTEVGSFDDLSPINTSFYNGYVTIQPTQLSNNEEDTTFSTYITFGHLLTLIQHLGIPVESPSKPPQSPIQNNIPIYKDFKGNDFTPIVKIDYHPDNTIINRGPLEASIDPNTCLIPLAVADRVVNGNQVGGKDAFSVYLSPLPTQTSDVLNWLKSIQELGNRSKNLFINTSENKINNVLRTSFEGKLFNILINIDFVLNTLKNLTTSKTTGISLQSLLESILDGINLSLGQINNLRVFFDDNSQCIRIIDEIATEDNLKGDNILEIPNYGTTSTVYDYGFQSKISPNLASQIVISTQAENSGGLQEFSEDVLTYKKLNDDVQDKFAGTIKQPQNSRYVPNDIKGLSTKSLQPFFDHLYLCYSGSSRKVINPSSISSLTNVYKELQNTQKKFLKQSYGNVLIPLEYSITIDGISGILPYNAFKVPDNRLPKKYRNKVAFAVFSINHNFENNQWTTTLRGQTLLLNKASIEEITPEGFIGPLLENQTQ